MRLSPTLVLTLLSATFTHAAPADELYELQQVLSEVAGYSDLLGTFGEVAGIADRLVEGSRRVFGNAGKIVDRWVKDGRDYIKQNGLIYELLSSPSFREYQMRVTEPSLCDADVQQYSGYLDITDGKHLFFWFFEARHNPEDAPLILWLNGGPGCSSSTGLLFELGPCSVSQEGRNVTYNKHSWTSHANVIFLDQPINVGFSYSSDGSTVSTSPVAGEDVYAFLELFLMRYPKYASAPFHLAAESYGGTYAPNIANVIYKRNKELDVSHNTDVVRINLASVMIGNGITDPYTQMATVPTFACDGPYPIYDDPEGPQCSSLRSKAATCQRLIKSCYTYNSRLACVPAGLYCNSNLFGPIRSAGRNPYDVRQACDPQKDGNLCYKQMDWINTWMNQDEHKKALGVDPELRFESCNMQVNQAFFMQGDGMHNSAPLLTDLVNNGVRLLVYAGNADYMCNFIGNEAWLESFENKFQSEFISMKPQPWVALETGKVAGTVRAAGGGGFTAGNVTFVTVHDAGHMVPYNQPEAALDLVTRWILNVPLS